MSPTSSPIAPEPGNNPGASVPLAVVVASNLANTHSTVQCVVGLAALALTLAHDALLHKSS